MLATKTKNCSVHGPLSSYYDAVSRLLFPDKTNGITATAINIVVGKFATGDSIFNHARESRERAIRDIFVAMGSVFAVYVATVNPDIAAIVARYNADGFGSHFVRFLSFCLSFILSGFYHRLVGVSSTNMGVLGVLSKDLLGITAIYVKRSSGLRFALC